MVHFQKVIPNRTGNPLAMRLRLPARLPESIQLVPGEDQLLLLDQIILKARFQLEKLSPGNGSQIGLVRLHCLSRHLGRFADRNRFVRLEPAPTRLRTI